MNAWKNDLVRPKVVVELRPPLRDEPVVPGLRLLLDDTLFAGCPRTLSGSPGRRAGSQSLRRRLRGVIRVASSTVKTAR
jgi:hypothetical protein